MVQMFMCDEQLPPVDAALRTATAVKNNVSRWEDDTGLLYHSEHSYTRDVAQEAKAAKIACLSPQ